MMVDFRKFVEINQSDDGTMALIDKFDKYQLKCKSRRVDTHDEKTAVYLDNSPIG